MLQEWLWCVFPSFVRALRLSFLDTNICIEREGFRLTVFPELAGGARDQKGFFLPHTTALEVMTLTKDESKRPARYVLRDSDTLLSLGRDWPF